MDEPLEGAVVGATGWSRRPLVTNVSYDRVCVVVVVQVLRSSTTYRRAARRSQLSPLFGHDVVCGVYKVKSGAGSPTRGRCPTSDNNDLVGHAASRPAPSPPRPPNAPPPPSTRSPSPAASLRKRWRACPPRVRAFPGPARRCTGSFRARAHARGMHARCTRACNTRGTAGTRSSTVPSGAGAGKACAGKSETMFFAPRAAIMAFRSVLATLAALCLATAHGCVYTCHPVTPLALVATHVPVPGVRWAIRAVCCRVTPSA